MEKQIRLQSGSVPSRSISLCDNVDFEGVIGRNALALRLPIRAGPLSQQTNDRVVVEVVSDDQTTAEKNSPRKRRTVHMLAQAGFKRRTSWAVAERHVAPCPYQCLVLAQFDSTNDPEHASLPPVLDQLPHGACRSVCLACARVRCPC